MRYLCSHGILAQRNTCDKNPEKSFKLKINKRCVAIQHSYIVYSTVKQVNIISREAKTLRWSFVEV